MGFWNKLSFVFSVNTFNEYFGAKKCAKTAWNRKKCNLGQIQPKFSKQPSFGSLDRVLNDVLCHSENFPHSESSSTSLKKWESNLP